MSDNGYPIIRVPDGTVSMDGNQLCVYEYGGYVSCVTLTPAEMDQVIAMLQRARGDHA